LAVNDSIKRLAKEEHKIRRRSRNQESVDAHGKKWRRGV